MQEQTNYKSFMLGALIGGAIGAATALLFAPKSGRELRRDIADTSTDIYDKASDYISNAVQDGKYKAQSIIDSAKRQADTIITDANEYKESVQNRFEHLKGAAKAGSDAFKAGLKSTDE